MDLFDDFAQAALLAPWDSRAFEKLVHLLRYQQSEIENLKAEVQKLKKPSGWALRQGTLYDSGAHLKPQSKSD